MEKVESFEKTVYNVEPGPDKAAVVYEIATGAWGAAAAAGLRSAPNESVRVSLSGNVLRIYFHCYEMHVPARIKEVESNAKTVLDNAAKYLKKEYKARTKKPLVLKEKRDLANYTIQKVSLNERYYYVSWRFYEIG